MKTKITVSGSIVRELSEKIPNNIIALNELIKNAYDAGSNQVDINISTNENKLTIKDYGIGMNEEDIKKLFHISSSSKKYGEVSTVNGFKRIMQGSKGLGFLSVFKFGSTVNWKTSKDKVLKFSVDYNDILKKSDISEYYVPINELNEEFIGTEITIDLTNYNTASLTKYFYEEKNRNKLLNSFVCLEKNNTIKHDSNFIVTLKIDNQEYKTDLTFRLQNESPDQQLVRVKYDSDKEIINYYSDRNESILLYSEHMDFKSRDYSVVLDLQTFVLKPRGKEKISKLFLNPISEELTPLVYVNNNLFNNFDLFDTNLMSSKKYSYILSQMIGYVTIFSNSTSIDFNSDRTRFVQNELTDDIAEFLERLNERIQTTGSQLKNELNGKTNFLKVNKVHQDLVTENFDCLSLVTEDFKIKSSITYKKTKDAIEYELFDMKRKVIIECTEKEMVTVKNEFYFLKLSEEDKERIDSELISYNVIKFNGDIVESYDLSKEGTWEFSRENDSHIYLRIIQILNTQQPKIIQKTKVVELHKEYSYDDLFDFENSFYEKDKGIFPNLNTQGINDIHNDKKKGIISFGMEKEISFPVNLSDKTTRKTHEIEAVFRVISKANEVTKATQEINFIKMPLSKGSNLPQNIVGFIAELNKLNNEEEFSYSFVSSFRTLVELCVIDILNENGIDKDKSLSNNYKEVLKLYPNFIDSISDNGDRQKISNMFNAIESPAERKAYISFLNLCTHGSSTMISKKEVEYKTKELTLLLEYLNFLNKK